MDKILKAPQFGRFLILAMLVVQGYLWSKLKIASAQEISWPVQWPDRGTDIAGKLVWSKARNQWSLEQSGEITLKLTEVQSIQGEARSFPLPGFAETPHRVVAVLSYQERLTGSIGELKSGRILSLKGLTLESTDLPLNAVSGWSFHPNLTVYLFEDFHSDSKAELISVQSGMYSTIDRVRPVTGELALNLPDPLRLSDSEYLLQFGFLLPETKTDLKLEIRLIESRDTKDSQQSTIRLVYDATRQTLAAVSPESPELKSTPIPLQTGLHWFNLQWRPDRTTLSIDDLVLSVSRSSMIKIPRISRVILSADRQPDSPVWSVGAFGLYDHESYSPPVQRSLTDDLVQVTGGHEFLGELIALNQNSLEIKNETTRKISTGHIRTLLSRDDKVAGRWLNGPVVRITFRNPTLSQFQIEEEKATLERLGLLQPPQEMADCVEGVLISMTDSALELGLSQGGTVKVSRIDLISMNPIGATGLRVLASRPHHLGDEVDFKVIPPEPEGNHLALDFETNAEEAAYRVSLAVDVLQVLGANIPPFIESIKRGELVTEIWINDQKIDTLNRHVLDRNEKPQRIMIALPEGIVKPGSNRLEFRQKGQKNDPNYLDDLSILGVRLYRID